MALSAIPDVPLGPFPMQLALAENLDTKIWAPSGPEGQGTRSTPFAPHVPPASGFGDLFAGGRAELVVRDGLVRDVLAV